MKKKGLIILGTPVATKAYSDNVINSAQAIYTYNGETINDVILNVYDLRCQVMNWTQESNDSWGSRVHRGTDYTMPSSAANRDRPYYGYPDVEIGYGSRLVLYIK